MKNKHDDYLESSVDILKSLVGYIPVAGTYAESLSQLITRKQDKVKAKRLEYFVEHVRESLSELNQKIDSLSEENKVTLALAIEKSMANVKNEIITEKREAYARFIRNLFLSPEDSDIVIYKTELFLTTLESITLLEIKVLNEIYKVYEEDTQDEVHLDIIISSMQNNIGDYLVSGTVSSLKNKGLVVDGEVFEIIYIADSGHGPSGKVKLSDFGRQFLNYCFTEL